MASNCSFAPNGPYKAHPAPTAIPISMRLLDHHPAIYILIQRSGTRSSIVLFGSQRFGATTIFSGFALSHAPHQEKVLFAIMLWRHRLISCKW